MPEENRTMNFRKWVAVFGTMLGAFMAVHDIQITNSSLRDISGGIAATPDEGSWISTAYLVGEIVTIALTAWFAKVFTLRYYLVANVLLFLLFSALCGISTSLSQMIVFRASQGFTGGVFIPMALTVIVSTMPKNLLAIGLGSLVAMLEEGQRKDWFGSPFIRNCAILATIFVPLFVIIELVREKPFVNFRLLACRNLAFTSIIAFGLGLALYSTIFLIPLYLGTVQGYSPLQIGEVLIWVGLPQFLIFPFLPLLMKRFDQRLLVCCGCLIFAVSCYMNISMSFDYAGDQLRLANLVRAFGQPFTIVPITGLAVATLASKDGGSGSAIFNIFRNIGGSFGIAILSTLVTRREQFHDLRIGELVTVYSPATQARLAAVQENFVGKGFDATMALKQSYAAVKSVVTREAFVMAFNDAFLVISIALLVCAGAIWFCKKPSAEETRVPAGRKQNSRYPPNRSVIQNARA